MWKNYMLAALNVAVAGLPFLVGWDLVLYGVYCGFAVLLLGLTAWNPVGDWFSILFVFYAKAVPEEALIMPALRRYLREAISGKGYLKPKCRFYYFSILKHIHTLPAVHFGRHRLSNQAQIISSSARSGRQGRCDGEWSPIPGVDPMIFKQGRLVPAAHIGHLNGS